jgi:hypothetical protein
MKFINKIRKFLGMEIIPRCQSTDNFWDKEGYRCSLEEGHEGIHSHEYHTMHNGLYQKAYHGWDD